MRPVQKIKAKYYAREMLKYLLVLGVLTVAGGGPFLGIQLSKKIFGNRQIPKRKSYDMFRHLKRRGLIELRREGNDVAILLTKEGRKQAGKYQIDDLFIERPKKWDGKWRVIVFDIPIASNLIRSVFRRKLKEFGFYRLQQSIWVFPFECEEEIRLLRDFLGASNEQIRFIEAVKIEDDAPIRRYFRL